MGFIARGGLFGHTIFLNTINTGISSSWYLKCNSPISSYDPSFLYSSSKSKSLIRNWKKQPLDQITIEKYPSPDKYESSKKCFCISDVNCNYLDILYYTHSYIWRKKILQTNSLAEYNSKQNYSVRDVSISLINSNCNFCIKKIAEVALRSKHYYTAYGLFNKCLSADHIDDDIRETSQDGLSSIEKSAQMSSSICDFIMGNLKLDLFEFMWILDELDHNMVTLT